MHVDFLGGKGWLLLETLLVYVPLLGGEGFDNIVSSSG